MIIFVKIVAVKYLKKIFITKMLCSNNKKISTFHCCQKLKVVILSSYYMPVTCATCGLKFETITATIDHVRDINQDQIGELRADLVNIFNSDDPRDIQTLNGAMSGFSHRQFRDRYGNLLPLGATQLLNLWPFAGAFKYCQKCQSEFGDYYRLYLHYSETRHSRPPDLERKLNELRLIERDHY
jgi:hypothetical protein